jgi:hypothetical protein
MPATAAPPTITATLLLPQDRIARAPLGAWAGRLHSHLVRCRTALRRSRDLAGEIAGIANNAALIAAHAGDWARAWALCEGQIHWQLRLSRRSRDVAIAAHALQPWVNLGRLQAVEGDWQSALARFAQLEEYRLDRGIALDCARIAPSGWRVISSSPERFENLLRNIQVTDSLKALLLNGEWGQVPVFASRMAMACTPGRARYIAEASIVAASRRGEHQLARDTAVTAVSMGRGWHRLVFRLRLAEVAACSSERTDAVDVLRFLAGLILKLSPEAKQLLQNLYVILRNATACREVGLQDEAVLLAREVHAGGRAVGDEVFELEALHILAEAAPAPERENWRRELARLEETTSYSRYRRGGGPPDPAVIMLAEELVEFFSQ